MGELLKEMEQHTGSVRFEAMANIISVHSQSDGKTPLHHHYIIVIMLYGIPMVITPLFIGDLHTHTHTYTLRQGDPVHCSDMDEGIFGPCPALHDGLHLQLPHLYPPLRRLRVRQGPYPPRRLEYGCVPFLLGETKVKGQGNCYKVVQTLKKGLSHLEMRIGLSIVRK